MIYFALGFITGIALLMAVRVMLNRMDNMADRRKVELTHKMLEEWQS